MFSWGENIRDGFGLVKSNGLVKANTDSCLNVILTKSPITHLSAGNKVVAFIRSNGKVSFACRMHQYKDGRRVTWKLKGVECREKILALSCGDTHVVLLSEEGRVFCLTSASNDPRPVGNLNQVIQVACGDQHSIALTQDGKVFTWGQNSRGQLGLGKGEPSTSSPQPVKSLSGIPLAQITAGGDHSFALSLSGAVFGWGKNSAGQLGLGDTIDRPAPAPVDCLNLKKTIAISCGVEHTVVLTKGGLVFTFGSGRYGQLGHNSLRNELRPRLVAELWGAKVTQIACGRNHTLAFVGSFKKIYSFGHGEQGQLGNGVKMDQSVPLPVQLPQDRIDDLQIEQTFAGGNHSFALCSFAKESGKGLNDCRVEKMTQTLDNDIIDRWILQCDSKSWEKIQKEITKTFSSASCLNGSFLDKSCDKHYQTSLKHSGLDLSLARMAFQKLAEKDKVLAEVEDVVHRILLPSLSKDPIGVEGLRVYLIIPELLRVLLKQQRGIDITEAFVATVLRLNPDKLQVIEGLWSTLSDSFFRTVVKAFHSLSAEYLQQMAVKRCDHGKSLKKTFGLLQRLYDVNSKRRRRITVDTFHVNKISSLFQSKLVLDLNSELTELVWDISGEDDTYWIESEMILSKIKRYKDNIFCLLKVDTEAKCTVWMYAFDQIKDCHEDIEYGWLSDKTIKVDRETLLDDTFQQLRKMTCHMVALKVKFQAENGVDEGGVSLEFFSLLGRELLTMEPKTLEVYESGLAWLTTDDGGVTDEFYLLGLLCGKALFNQCVLNLCFPLALFKELLGLTTTLDDLKELSPTEASCLQYVLDEDEEVVEALDLVFMDKGQELIPNVEELPVTMVNRKKYVDLYVDMKLNKSVQIQFADFEKGFHKGCPIQTWRMFLPEELTTLLQGDDNYEWDKLRECNARHHLNLHIIMFCWGDGSSGQFGLNFENVSVPIAGNIFSDKVTEIVCGEQHTLFLTVDGRILSCGRNSKGQLGRQRNINSKLPAPVEGLGAVVSVACGQDHSVAVCASGQVYSWGAGGEGQLGIALTTVSKVPRPRPVRIPSPLPITVIQVACGNSHSLALTEGGQVFSWGLNSHGQLGLGKGVPLQPIPALVRSLTGVPVTQVAAGGTHTLALTLPGLVYCCGANRAGQLGLKRVDEKGWTGTFGEGSRGQLGHNASANELLPKLVEGMDGLVSQIACGSHHTLVLGSSGQLWAFGSGVKGQLGTGNTEGSLRPTSVLLKTASGGAETVILNDMKISVGWNSNFIYTAESSEREQPIGRLDKAKLQKWLTMKQGNTEAQREISLMFSTSSSLVASFTKASESPSTKAAGALRVDLEAASQAFDQLFNIPWIRKSVNILPLVDNIFSSAAVIKSPEIFLILPTIPLFHEDHNVMNMVMTLAIVIDEDLNETAMKILKEWWSSMETNIMTKHILMWKNALSFMLRNGLLATHNPGVKFLLEALKSLHRANKRAGRTHEVPASTFYVEEINGSVILLEDVKLWRFWSTREDTEVTPVIFCRYPFVLNLISKMTIFNSNALYTKVVHKLTHRLTVMYPSGTFRDNPESPPAPVFQLTLRRPSLIEDTFRQLGAADHDYFQRELVVQFVEDMKLSLVNIRDFFLHVFEELLASESEMFMYNDTKTLVWFPAKPRVEEKSYFLFGVLCGMALYNHNIVHLPFPLALFKKMVGVKPSLEDLREFDPVVGGSLRYLLEDYTDDDVEENLDMTFTVIWDDLKVELDPKETGKSVTSFNKKQFVDAYVNLAFNQSAEKVFEEFRRGFFKVCDRDVVELFQPEELRGVMVGKEDYDWDTFKQNTVYDGEYHARHPNIVTFWEAFEELTDDQKKAFLLFLTGCDRAPILGMDKIQMKVAVLQNSTELHFPESLTCHFLLLLPIYPSKEMLLARLKEAVAHNRGFWKE
ncbi:LOW QUALITY PROTEIN: putative E3 ubiquitin-protein ligase HERC6 [Salvelinus alpinus]